jgi:hypothetical protein
MKVEIALDPSQVQSLASRVAPATARGGAARAPAQPRRGGGRPRQPRPQKKTAEELDAEMAVCRVTLSVADNPGIQGHQCGGVGSAWGDFWYMSGVYELRRGHDANAMCLLFRCLSLLHPQHLTNVLALPIHLRHASSCSAHDCWPDLYASITLPCTSALRRVPLQLKHLLPFPSSAAYPPLANPRFGLSVSTHDPRPLLLPYP